MKKIFLLSLCCFFSCVVFAKPKRAPQSGGSSDGSALARIYQAEDQRLAGDKRLQAFFSYSSRRVVKAAILAAGRNRDSSYLENLSSFLNRKDKELKQLAAFSMGLIGNELAIKILQQHLAMQKDSETITAIVNALGIAASEKSLNTVSGFLKPGNDADVMEAACEAVGKIFSTIGANPAVSAQDTLKDLVALAGGGEPIARSAAFALSRWKNDFGTITPAQIMAAAKKSNWPETRELLIRTLGRFKTTEVASFLIHELNNSIADPGVRIEAAKALATHPASESLFAALKSVFEEGSNQLVYQALETTFNLGAAASPALTAPIESLFKNTKSVWIKGAALKTLAGINPPVARKILAENMAQAGSPLLEYCIGALGILGTSEELEKVLGFLSHSKNSVVQAALEALSQTPEEKFPESAKPLLRKAVESTDIGIISLVSQIVEKHRWKDFAGPLSLSYRMMLKPDQVEARVAILSALAVVADPTQLDVVEEAFSDNERVVVEAAVKAKKALTGKDESERIPLNSKITKPATTNYDEIKNTGGRLLVFKTNRGDITVKLFDDTALVNFQILKLVKDGFFSGKTWHRVVPNFVVQGGDPRGDGFGGPGYLIRDQYSPVSPERGMVGIATAGQDTGGSQLFFNLAPNLHLRGRYTFFGEVTKGHEVLDSLEVHDKILSAAVK